MSGPVGVVLMTALPPTEGHLALVSYASHFMASLNGTVRVIMCVLPDEPPGRAEHLDCLREAVLEAGLLNVSIEAQFSSDPQRPSGPDDDEFWAHWVRMIVRQHREVVTHVFSSEPYGYHLATALQVEPVIYDMERASVSVRATDVRDNLRHGFPMLVRPLRNRLRRRICLFGQESVGKSTAASLLAEITQSVWVPEWARPYLESLPTPEVTHERMKIIARGQYAAERTADSLAEDMGCPFIFLDTDLMSTVGYQAYWSAQRIPYSQGAALSVEEYELQTMREILQPLIRPADLYIVMQDEGAPFVPDPLRYGGDRRETTRDYWLSLLRTRGYPLYEMKTPVGSPDHVDELLRVSIGCLEERAGFVGYTRRENDA